MLFEILEHIIDPEKLMNVVLDVLKSGGLVAITIPLGIPEAQMLLDNRLNIKSTTKRLMQHVRRFDYEKTIEMFKNKKDLKIDEAIPSQYYYVTFKK